MFFELLTGKQRAVAYVSRNGGELLNFPAFKDDYDVVMTAVRQNGLSLQFASERLRDDFHVVIAAVQNKGHAIAYASPNLRMKKGVCWAACMNDGLAIVYINQNMRDDKDVALAAAMSNGHSVRFLSEKTMENQEIALAAISEDSHAVVYLRPQSRLEFPKGDLVTQVIMNNSLALDFMDPRFRSDEATMALACLEGNPAAARLADMSVPGVRRVVLEALRRCPTVFHDLTNAQRDDDELAAVAIAADPFNVLFASWRIQSTNRPLVLGAVSRNGEVLVDLPSSLQLDREIVMAAANSPSPTDHFCKPLLPEIGDLATDREVVMACVARYPGELNSETVHPSFHDDADVIAVAIVACVRLGFFRHLCLVLSHFDVLSSAVMEQLLDAGESVRAYFCDQTQSGHVVLKRVLAGVPLLPLHASEMQLLNAQVCCLLGHGQDFLDLVPVDASGSDYDDAVAAVAKHCPLLEQAALQVSARMHTPVDELGQHTALHLQQCAVFDHDMS